MAVLAQGHDGVVLILLDVMSIAWAGCITHRAGQSLHSGVMRPGLLWNLIVHLALIPKQEYCPAPL